MEESLPDVLSQTEVALFNFLTTELDLSITFATIASQASDTAKRERNLENAATGYETVLRYIERGGLTNGHRSELQPQIENLKAMLVKMGKIAPE